MKHDYPLLNAARLSAAGNRRPAPPRWPWLLAWGLVLLQSVSASHGQHTTVALSPALREIYFTGVPQSLADLQQMDAHQQKLFRQVSAVTVGLEIGTTQGSGVLVSEDGYILTAAHVAGGAGREVVVILPDGRKHRGVTLGMDKDQDAALVRIEHPESDRSGSADDLLSWPYAEMGSASDLSAGSWVLALGHPGGFQVDRQPVARFGRILAHSRSSLTTDCKLVGGDSGGPLFDMEGRVVGIHSRIGSQITRNIHVAVGAYRDSWERLARGDSWGSLENVVGRPLIGVLCEEVTDEARITGVIPASPAERAGIRPGDLVTRFGEHRVQTFDDLQKYVNQRQPGDEVTLVVQRGNERLELTVILASVPRT